MFGRTIATNLFIVNKCYSVTSSLSQKRHLVSIRVCDRVEKSNWHSKIEMRKKENS